MLLFPLHSKGKIFAENRVIWIPDKTGAQGEEKFELYFVIIETVFSLPFSKFIETRMLKWQLQSTALPLQKEFTAFI